MEYHVLASGSKGNSTFVYTKGFGILIDCGISRKQLVERLGKVGFQLNDIQCVLLTHDHSDHKKGMNIFDLDHVYSGMGNMENLPKRNILKAYQPIGFGSIEITPLKISHDATSPMAFVIEDEVSKFVYMTDTGYVSQKNMKYIQNADYYVIESNHDVNKLMSTNRPLFLKKRILSDLGHLSNEYSAQLMCKVLGKNTKNIVLAHLSQEANTPELALNAYYAIFESNQINIKNYNIVVAQQNDVVSGGNLSENQNSQRWEDQREISSIGN